MFRKILSLKNEKSEKISSHPSLSSVGLWYSKRPARTHDERVFYGFKNNPQEAEIFEKYWWKMDRKKTEKEGRMFFIMSKDTTLFPSS